MDLSFDFSWWKTIWWLVAVLGIGGTIALVAAYPVVLAVVLRFFRIVFSYRIGCALGAAIAAALIADYWRHSVEDAKHAAEVAAFELAQVERDKRIATETRDLVLKEVAEAAAESAVMDKNVKDFTDALPKPPETGNPFAIGTDACRLRAIVGQAGCGSDGAKGVPETNAKPASIRDRIRKRLPGSVSGGPGSNQ